MDNQLHDIEELFRQALENNKEMPPAKVWDAVSNRLETENTNSIKKKFKTWKRLSLLLLFLLSTLVIYEVKNSMYGNAGKKNLHANGTIAVNDKSKQTAANKKSVIALNDLNKNTPAGTPAVNTGETLIRKEKKNEIAVTKNYTAIYNPSSLYFKQYNNIASNTEQPVPDNNADVQPGNLQPVYVSFNLLPFEKQGNKQSIKITAVVNKINPVINSNAAAANNKKTKPSLFSLTGFFSPDVASYSLDDEDGQPDLAKEIKKTEHHEFSYTCGLLLDYSLSKKWAVQSGITLSSTNIAIEPRTVYAQTDNSGGIKYKLNISSGYGYIVPAFQPLPQIGDSAVITGAAHKLIYIGVPVAVKYQLTNRKISIEAMAGAGINFLTTGKLETEITKGPDNEMDMLNNLVGLKKIYFTGLAGISIGYRFNSKISFVLMPSARFALNPINKSVVVKTYPNSIGLAAGLKIKL